uniref:Coiled-coil domain-containing protein 74B n=1 Tax=Schistocephalus solidus TaxID=70667 RepID=A0A0X3PEJ2_SCHSO
MISADNFGQITDKANDNYGENVHENSEEPHTTKNLVLEKTITFLKAQHREMLQALQKEIEKLKLKNIDLQRRLVLETKGRLVTDPVIESEKNTIDQLSTVQEMKKKIVELQENLRLALESNKLLKKELEAKRLHSGSTRHNMAESHAPIIQQAEQVKATMQGTRKATSCRSELNVNTGVRGIVQDAYEDKELLNVNHSNVLYSVAQKTSQSINRGSTSV